MKSTSFLLASALALFSVNAHADYQIRIPSAASTSTPVSLNLASDNLQSLSCGENFNSDLSRFLSIKGTNAPDISEIIWKADNLPSGLSLSSAGVISGSPSALGESLINVTASYGDIQSNASYSLSIGGKAPSYLTSVLTYDSTNLGRIRVAWSGLESSGCGETATRYKVLRGTSTSSMTVIASNLTSNYYDDFSVSAGDTVYYYRVIPYNDVGDGSFTITKADYLNPAINDSVMGGRYIGKVTTDGITSFVIGDPTRRQASLSTARGYCSGSTYGGKTDWLIAKSVHYSIMENQLNILKPTFNILNTSMYYMYHYDNTSNRAFSFYYDGTLSNYPASGNYYYHCFRTVPVPQV